jgi:hypothetical protein
MTGPDDPESLSLDDGSGDNLIAPINPTRYMITAITNAMRMIQQKTYPAVVAVFDVRFLIVMTSTTIATMHNNMNSYMYDLRT